MNLFTSISTPTEFSLVSTSRDADPPVFTLTFIVDSRAPTVVTCNVESIMFNILNDDLSREVLASEDPISVQVIVTVRMRQGGSYQCTVSNDAPNGNTAMTQAIPVTGMSHTEFKFQICYPLLITLISIVTDTPTNLTPMRIGLYQGIISWSPPVSNDPVVVGYELFYDLPNGIRESIEVNGTLMTFSTLDPETSYPVFVVAYGGDLPSSHNTETLQEGKKF